MFVMSSLKAYSYVNLVIYCGKHKVNLLKGELTIDHLKKSKQPLRFEPNTVSARF